MMAAVELTHSWQNVVPKPLQDRYRFVETRNAATTFQAGHPQEFEEVMRILDAFTFDLDRIIRGGGSKHLIPLELDEAFRELGWREARYDQELVTRLVLQPYRPKGETGPETRESTSKYHGHKVDNVKSRVALEVEWNPKDGNLDRDFGNFRALYDGGVLDVGIIVTRTEAGMRELWAETIKRAKAHPTAESLSSWAARLRKTPDNPLGTSTTSNFEKLGPRIMRGDGGGCPVLAIAITDACFEVPDDFDTELTELVDAVEAGIEPTRLAEKMALGKPDPVHPEF